LSNTFGVIGNTPRVFIISFGVITQAGIGFRGRNVKVSRLKYLSKKDIKSIGKAVRKLNNLLEFTGISNR
jgi:hypothetical protein